jgi:hypothetical protein
VNYEETDLSREVEAIRALEVRRLYEVFRGLSRQIPFLGCSCCTRKETLSRCNSNFESIGRGGFVAVFDNAITLWGSVDEFKHFCRAF